MYIYMYIQISATKYIAGWIVVCKRRPPMNIFLPIMNEIRELQENGTYTMYSLPCFIKSVFSPSKIQGMTEGSGLGGVYIKALGLSHFLTSKGLVY